MTRRDCLIRLSGLAAIGAGGGVSLWLRALMLGPPHDPTLLEFVLILASFAFALGGAVLLLNGAKLFGARHIPAANHWHDQTIGPLGDDRAMLADVLARKARANRGR